ncbi:glyoxalase/Bleomycin resistance protein/Dioxygenase [Colletotrichum karsti]|uniref:Glyoxalase/Bleomycin resistance protein/Dioxygenase n=1 Tax=Colletotrichum karsti TaxID=1095194 RepID=A0A9P6LMV6_9PEZI|nr:glyoxalase/Bleomycin resistance protein/Dioxygenase [Colletotrichum karsti]KAF9877907.1 glyoxalase/Bleomycin resistance protein/Dioxygenase [Colletotrichum karsti]
MSRMADFYASFLGGSITYDDETVSFITYNDEQYRITLLPIPETTPKESASCGPEHIALSFDSLADLLLSYRRRWARGIEPVRCVNHGPTTSIYYKDPDGNMLETQVDNFDTVEETTAFMTGANFTENPVGTDFDAEEMIEALRAGKDEKTLKKLRQIGPRGLHDFSSL